MPASFNNLDGSTSPPPVDGGSPAAEAGGSRTNLPSRDTLAKRRGIESRLQRLQGGEHGTVDAPAVAEVTCYRAPLSEKKGVHTCKQDKECKMIGILIAVLPAALVYAILAAVTGSAIVAIVGAVLVLLAGIPSGGFGFGSRFGGRRGANH